MSTLQRCWPGLWIRCVVWWCNDRMVYIINSIFLSSSCWTLLRSAHRMLMVSTLSCRGRRKWSFIMVRSSRAFPSAWRTATTACRPHCRSRATNMLLWWTITALLWVRYVPWLHSENVICSLGGFKITSSKIVGYLQENYNINVCLNVCVGELLNTNGTVFKETLGAVCESYSSIKGAVGEGVERCKERVLHQQKLSQEAQNSMLEILVRTPWCFEL